MAMLDGNTNATARSEVALLVKEAAAGNEVAWGRLVARFSGLVTSIARSYRLGRTDSEDVIQTVWLRLVEGVGTIRDPERVGAWLAAVTRHESLRMLRRAGRESPVADTGADHTPSDDRHADEGILETERRLALWEALDRLPARTQAVMRCLLTEPTPGYDDVAAGLGIPINSISPTRHRAVRALRHSPALAAIGRQAS